MIACIGTGPQDRQAAGIAVAKRQGVYRGRAKGITKGEPDLARKLLAKGLIAPEIAQAMGVSLRTVFRYLHADNQDPDR